MNIIPKSAIRILELQNVSLPSVGLNEPQSTINKVSKSKGLLSRFSKSKPQATTALDKRSQQHSFEVASWLRFGLSEESRLVTLCLSYTDSSGDYVALVEEQSVKDKASTMMSAVIDLQTKGPIQKLAVACAGLKVEDRCYIEDLTIKRITQEQKVSA